MTDMWQSRSLLRNFPGRSVGAVVVSVWGFACGLGEWVLGCAGVCWWRACVRVNEYGERSPDNKTNTDK